MLRLISVIGIALAMVIGFIAISTQMKDDYSVRSRVVDVLKQMKNLATEELRCDSQNSEQEKNNDDTAGVEISSEPEITPLVNDDTQDSDAEQAPETVSDEDSEPANTDPESASEKQSNHSNSVENTLPERNADIIKTMGYRMMNSDTAIEVIVIFNDVKGESGKTLVKHGSRVVIHCSCISQAMSCKIVESNINKNYLPNSLTKPQT